MILWLDLLIETNEKVQTLSKKTLSEKVQQMILLNVNAENWWFRCRCRSSLRGIRQRSEEGDPSDDYSSNDENVVLGDREGVATVNNYLDSQPQILCGKQCYEWTTVAPPKNRRTPAHNIIRGLSGLTAEARALGNALKGRCFLLQNIEIWLTCISME